MYDDELMHYGVKGMKWGVRKETRYADNYSSKQRKRDEKIYGHRAVKRINKRMLKGESIQSARHNEVVRKGRKARGKDLAKKAGGAALTLGGAAAGAKFLQKHGKLDNLSSQILTEELINMGKSALRYVFR